MSKQKNLSGMEKRLSSNGKTLINPIASQAAGVLWSIVLFLIGVVLFENTIAEWSNSFWVWVWRIPFYPTLAWLAIKFFKAGLEPVMAIGSAGIPRIFGRPVSNAVYTTGRHWVFPGPGNKMNPVDMRSGGLELKVTVTTKDNYKMFCPINLNFYVYDPHVHAEVKDFEKTFQSMLSGAFLDFSSEKKAKEMLQVSKKEILEAIKKHIRAIPGTGYKIKEFGIETQQNTISIADGFDFVDQRSRDAFELKPREKRERKGQDVEFTGFLAKAKLMAKDLNISENEAFLRVMQLYAPDRKLPDEKILRLAGLPDELIDFLNKTLNRNQP